MNTDHDRANLLGRVNCNRHALRFGWDLALSDSGRPNRAPVRHITRSMWEIARSRNLRRRSPPRPKPMAVLWLAPPLHKLGIVRVWDRIARDPSSAGSSWQAVSRLDGAVAVRRLATFGCGSSCSWLWLRRRPLEPNLDPVIPETHVASPTRKPCVPKPLPGTIAA